jgi:hypothetical protein
MNWAIDLLARTWSHLLAQFHDDMTDDEARDQAEAMELVHVAQLEGLEEVEQRWRTRRSGI